jgi:hypothetical protein
MGKQRGSKEGTTRNTARGKREEKRELATKCIGYRARGSGRLRIEGGALAKRRGLQPKCSDKRTIKDTTINYKMLDITIQILYIILDK